MRLRLLLLLLPWLVARAGTCPWLNTATAAGILDGPVTTVTVDNTSCKFVRENGTRVLELRIEVGVPTPRCHTPAVPLKAIGTEAVACSDRPNAEQVIGRVRDKTFSVRVSTTDHSPQPALREKARKVAEHVAGILF